MFHFKLALDSLRKNKESYLPFLLAGGVAVALNFLVQLLIYSSGVRHLEIAADIVRLLLILGQVIIALLSLVITVYTYSFLKKGKEKEFGLYSILGMKKSDLIKISLIQQLLSFIITIVTGLVSGFVFAKLMILLLVKMVGGQTFGLELSSPAIWTTVAFFLVVFLLLTIIDVLAVLLVAVATYLLFIAASTLILKSLQKNDRYYYQSKHFITVSNMLFRMKQNAVGLASIALLTTMTLVVTVTTASMFFGKADLVSKMFPRDVTVSVSNNALSKKQVEDLVAKAGLTISKEYSQTTTEPIRMALNDSQKLVPTEFANQQNERNVQFMSLADYRALTGAKVQLTSNQVLAYTRNGKALNQSSVSFAGQKYTIKKNLTSIKGMPAATADTTPAYVFVLPTEESLQSVTNTLFKADTSPMQTSYYFNVAGSDKQQERLYEALQDKESDNVTFQLRFMTQKVMNALYGGFFFIGILFSITFILATGLMIYYKQISEGKADQAQFEILQKVGMSEHEIKKTIRSQIIWLFGLPIAVSLIHLSFAMPMINKLLLAFSVPLTDAVYIVMATTILLMVLIYFIIYKITSHTYFRQVTGFN